MKKNYIILLSVLSILWSCSKDNPVDEPQPNDPQEIELSEKSASVIESMNEFGLDIFQLLVEDEPDDKNIFISPTSISLALAMTLNGANNATEDSMAYALRMDHLTAEEINETYRDLMEGLTTCDEKVLLEIANSIWYRLGYPVEPDFLDINETYFNAEVNELDFNLPEAVDIINSWVAEQTHNKITEIINVINPAHVMFLINAIYFKGIWIIEFDEENTWDETFYLADGGNKQVSMMHLEEVIGYYENDLLQICELDYGRGNFSMLVILPKHENNIEDVIDELNPENFDSWIAEIDTQKVNLSLPKFTFEYEKKLNEILGMMGMGIAFTPAADFTGISSGGGLWIDYVKHKTFVEVNEEGTEAAAVTVVAIIETSVEPETTMIVNRPFLFAIREKTTNTIVFLGKVAEPV